MTRERICAVALGEVGVTEASNRDRIEQYMASVTDSRWKIELFDSDGNPRKLRWGDAWCACFASWIYKEAGHPIEHAHGIGCYGCHRLIQHCATQSPSAWFDRSYEPKPGDLILFDWQLDPSALDADEEIDEAQARKIVDHVGIVLEVTDTHYITVEGNWGRSVKKLKRPVDAKYILGFGALLD